jgi:DNA end-binding protein Ku
MPSRAIWSGAISFGLVNVPVKLVTAVRAKDVRFNQLHAKDGARIRQKRVCSLDGDEVELDEIVKGYEIAPDHYVTITQQELDSVAPTATRMVEIEEFVDMSDIDPIFFENSYYALPDRGAAKPYALLQRAMHDEQKVAIGRVVMRTKEYLAAIRPVDNVLALATMRFADEIVPRDNLEGLPDSDTKIAERELAIARQLVESLSSPFEPSKYHDTYREAVLAMIERKADGKDVVQAAAEPAAPKPVDLMAALEASLEAAKSRTTKAAPAKSVPAKSAPKTRSTASRSKR